VPYTLRILLSGLCPEPYSSPERQKKRNIHTYKFIIKKQYDMIFLMNSFKKTYLRDGRAPIPKSEITSKVMSANKGKNTKPELLLRKALWNNGIKGYRLHWKKVPGKPDIAFPGKKIAIFVNGCFWHRCPICKPSMPKSNIKFWTEKFNKNIERDQKKIEALKALNWKVLTIWECELKKDLNLQVQKVKNLLEEP
jgi:DNA mismatch endonuclease (patch repair protein)